MATTIELNDDQRKLVMTAFGMHANYLETGNPTLNRIDAGYIAGRFLPTLTPDDEACIAWLRGMSTQLEPGPTFVDGSGGNLPDVPRIE